MTKELKETLDDEIKDALESGDEARINRCTARYVRAIGDCNYKTSDRVKTLVNEVNNIGNTIKTLSNDLEPMKKSHNKFQAMLNEKTIVCKWLGFGKKIFLAIVAIGGWELVHTIIDMIQKTCQ